MENKFKIITLVLLLVFSEAIAQSDFRDGFILTIKNDTVYGQVDYRSNKKNYESCRFRKGENITEYSPQQISGYGFLNDKFSAQVLLKIHL